MEIFIENGSISFLPMGGGELRHHLAQASGHSSDVFTGVTSQWKSMGGRDSIDNA